MWTQVPDRFAAIWGETGPVLGLLLLLALGLTLPRPQRRRMLVPLGLYLAHFGVALVRVVVPDTASAARPLALVSVFLVWASIGHSAFLLLVDALLSRRLAVPMPRIFRDIALAVLYFAAGLLTLRAAGVEPGSLLATSALLTAVIGLSLQDTLGNVFAGLSIQMQRPFEVGDWVQLTDSSEPLGRVTEINWRATKLLTNDRIEVIVPNSSLARATLRNFSKPTMLLRRQIEVSAPYAFSPEHIRAVLLAAVADTPGVEADPPATVVVHLFQDSGVLYRLRYFLHDITEVHPIDSAVRERMWYGLRRAGIACPFPQREVHLFQAGPLDYTESQAARQARRVRDLRRVDLFDALPSAVVERLAEVVHTRRYAPGETILRQGERGHELFIVEHGEVTILAGGGQEAWTEIARLGKGQFFGEMSLLTGESRAATVRATQDCALLVVDKAAFQPLLQEAPELAERVSAILAARQQQLALRPQEVTERRPDTQQSGVILQRIRDFFAL